MRRIVRESEGIGLPRPQFQFRDGHFKVTFFAPEDMLKLKSQGARPVFEVPGHLFADLSETQRTIIKQLIKRQTVKVPELAAELNVSPQAIRKAITPLVEARLVVQEGRARDTTYSLKEGLSE